MRQDEEQIFQTFKRTIEPKNTVLDIGCGAGKFLIEIDTLGFKKLIGIDKKNAHPIYEYFKALSEKTGLEHGDLILKNQTENKFEFNEIDFDKYQYTNQKYSAVIVRHFLHFIAFEKQRELLETLYGQLEKGGAMYVKLHHNTHPDYVTPTEHNKKIAENIIERSAGSKVYFVNEPDFKDFIRQFNVLWDCYSVDEESITAILKKVAIK